MNLIHVNTLFPSNGLLILFSTQRDVELHLCASNLCAAFRWDWLCTNLDENHKKLVNQRDSFSILTGLGAFCKHHRQTMFRWEGDFQVRVPSACLFLGGLKGWGEILVLFNLLRTFPQ